MDTTLVSNYLCILQYDTVFESTAMLIKTKKLGELQNKLETIAKTVEKRTVELSWIKSRIDLK